MKFTVRGSALPKRLRRDASTLSMSPAMLAASTMMIASSGRNEMVVGLSGPESATDVPVSAMPAKA